LAELRLMPLPKPAGQRQEVRATDKGQVSTEANVKKQKPTSL
jgi:hypothetical protein